MQKRRIYFDNATTTPVRPEVKKVMERFWTKDFGNPNSLSLEGVIAKRALDEARRTAANILNCNPDEIIFTSGGTESNNLAVMGFARALEISGTDLARLHFITTKIEHSSVLECFRELGRRGAAVEYLEVDSEGLVSLNELKAKLRPETVFVSVMYANNEIGTIEPVRKIANLIKEENDKRLKNGGRTIVFHSDASQAALFLAVNRDKLGADLVTLDAQKINGPKGVGLIYVKRGLKIEPILFGGGQESGIRPGTVNVPLVAGFALALELAAKNRQKLSERLTGLRDDLFIQMKKKFPKMVINGSLHDRLPNNVNFSYPGLDAEFAVLKLDSMGIACSTKSACLSGEEGSYVIEALGRKDGSEKTSLRFSFGYETKKSDLKILLAALERILH